MAAYSGTFAGRILAVRKESFLREKDREKATTALIEERLREELQLQRGQGATAVDAAAVINNETIQQAALKANSETNKLQSTLNAFPFRRGQAPLSERQHLINELNYLHHTKDIYGLSPWKATLRNQIHALIYLEAMDEAINQGDELLTPGIFSKKLSDLRDVAKNNPTLDATKSDLEKAIETTFIVSRQATKMDDNLSYAQKDIAALSNPRGAHINLLSSNLWQQERDDVVTTADSDALAAIQQKNQAHQTQLAAQPQLAAPTTPLSPQNVLQSLLKDFNDPAQATNKDTLRDQLHAVAYKIAADEKTSTPQNPKSVDDIFAGQLAHARQLGLDKEPTDLERLRLGEKKYDALAFMEKAMATEQVKHPHDANKAPNALELLHSKLVAINKEVEELQKKAKNTTNPNECAKLELEAARVLRLYDEVSNTLQTNQSGIIFKNEDARVRDSLVASLDAQSNLDLQNYLMALDAQRAELVKIAGKNAKESTPIPVGVLKTTEQERTGIIKKQGDFYGNISFKEKDKDGKWKSRQLEGKDGKPITGLTRAEIMDAITKAENQLRIQLKDPNYKIKVTESSDGTIHYDAGNSHNREVLHKAFIATYDLKVDAAAAAQQQAQSAVTQVPAPPSAQQQAQSTVTQVPVSPNSNIHGDPYQVEPLAQQPSRATGTAAAGGKDPEVPGARPNNQPSTTRHN